MELALVVDSHKRDRVRLAEDALDVGPRPGVAGPGEELLGRPLLDQLTHVEEDDVVRQPPRLAQGVRDEHYRVVRLKGG